MKNVYFLSDAHLGSLAIPHARMQERRLVRFLDSIKTKAAAVYLLGDMFDFWNEYKYVVPKGYTRFLGKLSELTDMGVEVHFFTGNHDLWTYGYLEEECGVTVHYKPQTVEIYDKVFYLAHGDGLGDPDKKFKFLKRMFQNQTCQRLLNAIHPRWGMALGLNWAKHSRLKRADGKEEPYMGEKKEFLVRFAKQYMQGHKDDGLPRCHTSKPSKPSVMRDSICRSVSNVRLRRGSPAWAITTTPPAPLTAATTSCVVGDGVGM